MLRHSCGFSLAHKSHDLRLIQDYIGHRDPRHTAHEKSAAAKQPFYVREFELDIGRSTVIALA